MHKGMSCFLPFFIGHFFHGIYSRILKFPRDFRKKTIVSLGTLRIPYENDLKNENEGLLVSPREPLGAPRDSLGIITAVRGMLSGAWPAKCAHT